MNREDLDMAVRDIVLRITQLTLENKEYAIILECRDIGYLYINTRPLRFRLRLSREVTLPELKLNETPEVKTQITETAKDHGLTVASIYSSDYNQGGSSVVMSENMEQHILNGKLNSPDPNKINRVENPENPFSNSQSRGKRFFQ